MMLKLPDENGDEGTSEATFAKTLTNTKEVPFFISNMDDRITPEVPCGPSEQYTVMK